MSRETSIAAAPPRLLVQGIQERVGFQSFQARITQPHSGIEPLVCFGDVAPLRIDRGVLAGQIRGGAESPARVCTPLNLSRLYDCRHPAVTILRRYCCSSIFFRLSKPPRYTPVISLVTPASLSASGGVSEVFLRLKLPLQVTLVIPPVPALTDMVDV
jgi:hypothetical protein